MLEGYGSVSRWDRIKNVVVIRRGTSVKRMVYRVDKSVLTWFGHIEWINVISLTKNANAQGRALTVRIKFGWMDVVKSALSKRRQCGRCKRAYQKQEWVESIC